MVPTKQELARWMRAAARVSREEATAAEIAKKEGVSATEVKRWNDIYNVLTYFAGEAGTPRGRAEMAESLEGVWPPAFIQECLEMGQSIEFEYPDHFAEMSPPRPQKERSAKGS